jgi:hypothetical protein
LCGYGACDEISGRRRDGPLADGREPCIFTGILIRRIGCGTSRNYIANMFTSIAMHKALQLRAVARCGGYDGHVSVRATLAARLVRIERTWRWPGRFALSRFSAGHTILVDAGGSFSDPAHRVDDALVFRIRFRERSFLLPGDAEKRSGHYILSESDPASRQSDVLKVGHHGSKNSVPEFLAAVLPRLGVISSGEDNPYGHPRAQLLERLRQAGIPTLRTDTNGAIHILTDGKIGKYCKSRALWPVSDITAQVDSAKPQTPQDQQSNQQQ